MSNPFDAFTPEPWTNNASCASHPHPDLWFAGEGELRGGTVRTVTHTTKTAQTICGTCPVRAECLDYALRINETFGVYGGLTGPQRVQLKNKTAA